MPLADVLVTEFRADATDYVRGANQAQSATRNLGGAISGIAIPALSHFLTMLGAVGTAYITFGIFASRKAAEFDAMVKALEAVEGSATKAKQALDELKKVAELPGLGLSEAVQGYTSLVRAGLSDNMAMRTVRAAGNANALASGGREELNRVLLAISQIAMKPQLQGEELMQLMEAGIPAGKIIQAKYGTMDGGQLAKMGVTSADALNALIEGLEKMPKAAGSAKNSWENFEMAIEQGIIGIGSGINDSIIPALDEFANVIGKLNSDGVFEELGGVLGEIALSVFPKLRDGADDLYDQFIELGAVTANVAAGMANLAQALPGLWNLINKITNSPLNPINAINIDKQLTDVFGDRYKTSTSTGGGISAGDEFKRRAAQRKKDRDSLAGLDEWGNSVFGPLSSKKAEEAANKSDEKANAHLMAIERHTKATADALTIGNSIIGGTSYGNNKVNSVNIGRIQGNNGMIAQGVAMIQAGIAQSQIVASRRR